MPQGKRPTGTNFIFKTHIHTTTRVSKYLSFMTAESYDQTSTKDRILLDAVTSIKEEIFPSFIL